MPELHNIAVVPGEQVHFGAEFHPNLIFKHLSHGILITDRRVVVRSPHTIFGIIPHGYVESSSPLDTISSFTAGKFISTRHLVLGSVFAVMALYSLVMMMAASTLGILFFLVFAAIAAYNLLSANNNGFVFLNFGSGRIAASAGTGEGHLVEQGTQVVANLLFNRTRV